MSSGFREKVYGHVCTDTHTLTKNISLADDAYEALASLKKPGESFSDVARRLARESPRRSIMEFAGSWKISRAEAERIKARIYADRDASLKPRIPLRKPTRRKRR